jgi:hypothetical protein
VNIAGGLLLIVAGIVIVVVRQLRARRIQPRGGDLFSIRLAGFSVWALGAAFVAAGVTWILYTST